MDAVSQPQEMTVKDAKETRVFKDVLVGDVWLCSGQSNMEFGWTFSNFPYSPPEYYLIETRNAITKFWQRNYYEHIIRDEKDLQRITNYIEANPLRWDEDNNNPINASLGPKHKGSQGSR